MGERKVPYNQRLEDQGKCFFNELAPLRRSERQDGKTVNSRLPLNEVKLEPVTFFCSKRRKQMISLAVKPVFANYFSLLFSSLHLSLWIFRRIEMWVYSYFSLPSLSLIGPLTTEIYYRTGITGNTERHTHTHTQRLNLTLFPHRI